MLILSCLTILLSFICVWMPYSEYKKAKIERDFHSKLKIFKLITVRRYYKSLKKLSFEEIEDKYNVDYIYEMIGRV